MFSLEVPISEEMPLAISQLPTQPTTGNPLPGRRLLVLDNEVSILESMSALLGQWGCEVVFPARAEMRRNFDPRPSLSI